MKFFTSFFNNKITAVNLNFSLIIFVLCFNSNLSFAQTLLAGWDFQTTTNGGTGIVANPNTQTTFNANVGSGIIYLNGTNGSSTWSQASELAAFGGTATNAGGSTGLSIVTTTPACLALLGGSSNSANGKSIVFKITMSGFKDLIISYATQKTSTGFNSQLWEYSADGLTWTSIGTAINPPSAFAIQTLSTITALDNAVNSFIKLTISGSTGTSQNNRLDNFQFNATSLVTPTITGSATAIAFTTTYGTPSTAQTFSVSGTALTTNLVATAPTGFEVASDGTTYGSTATFTQTSGSASGTLSVRLSANAAVLGSFNANNIVLSSAGATVVNITTAASGNIVTAKALTITGVTANNKNFDGTTVATLSGTPAYNGLVNGETFVVTGTPTATFATAAAAVAKPVTVTGYTAPTTNYTVAQPTGLNATIYDLSSASDVIAIVGSEAVSISSLINDNAPLSAVTGAQVWKITIRDGGATAPDNDFLPTKVNAITISRAATSSVIDFATTINTAALFDSAGTFIATASSITPTTITFSTLAFAVADNNSETYTLRLSLKPLSAIPLTIDGKDIGLSITATNITTVIDGTSSTFSSSTAAALTANNTNVIAVVATRLTYVQNATDTAVGSGMTPAITISANDANGNRDLNFVIPITITSTGSLSGTSVSATPAAGFATFSGLSHSAAGSGLILTTTNTSGLVNASSSLFNITTGPTILTAGDLAVIAVGTNTPDKIAFVLLKDINAGTVINFTDNGMDTASAGRFNEGFLIYTAPSSQCAGSVITWQNNQSIIGTGWDSNNPTNFDLNNTRDNLFVFQGSTANWATQTGITLLYGVTTNSTWITTGTATAQTSYSPASLDNLYKVNFSGFSENDVYLNALTISGTPAAIITNVTNTANFTKQSATFTMPGYTAFTIATSLSSLTAGLVCLGSNPTINISSAGLASGNYVVTYSLSGANTALNSTATMIFAAGSGSFVIPVLPNAGSTTITILKVNSGGCDRALSPNTTSVLVGAKSTYSAITGWDVNPVNGREIIFDADYNIAANLSGCSCTVNPGKAVTIPSGSSMILLNGIAVDTTNPITSLTFENTAPLIQINNVANSGNISVKRNSSQLMRLDYTLWSSPVAGQNLLAFSPATYNVGPSNIRFYTYSTTSNFYSIVPPASNAFAFGSGYLIRMPDNHPTTPTIWPGQFTGIPNNGNTSVPISYISNTQAFNSIGNPYPSPINLYDITTGFMKVNAANIESTIYFWRKTNSNTANSGYCSYNNNILVSATNSTFNGTNPNGVIQTGQGFLVTAKAGATSVLFNNDMRIASTVNQFNKTVEAEHNTIWLNLINDTNGFAQTAVTYRPNGTNNIDDYDGVNLNDGQISLGSAANNKNYIIQSRLFPFNETDVVPLIIKTNASANYTFAIDHLSGFFMSRTQPIYLKDKLFNVLTDLNNGNYTFTATSGTDSNRFEIVYQNILSLPANTATSNAVVVYKNNNDFVINAGSAAISNVKIYDLQGRLLLSKVNINNLEVRLNIGNVNQMIIIKTTLIDGEVFSTKALN